MKIKEIFYSNSIEEINFIKKVTAYGTIGFDISSIDISTLFTFFRT